MGAPKIANVSPLIAREFPVADQLWRIATLALVFAAVLVAIAVFTPRGSAGQVAAALGFFLSLVIALFAVSKARSAGIRTGRQVSDVSTILGPSPNGYFRLADGVASCSKRLCASLGCETRTDIAAIAARFDDPNILTEAVRNLVNNSLEFSRILRAGDRYFRVEGALISADNVDAVKRPSIVWFHDVSDLVARSIDAANVGDAYRETLDLVPFPVWRRNQSGKLSYCNRAYAGVVSGEMAEESNSDRERILENGGIELISAGRSQDPREMALAAMRTGESQSGERHAVIAGQRRLLDILEMPCRSLGTVGSACDITRLETARRELQDHLAAHSEVLENLGTAIAIFGADKQLAFSNHSLANLWGLDQDWLDTRPPLSEILEVLRDKRRIPEVVNFPEFKARFGSFFTELIDPHEEVMHLPDETILRMVVTPHPLGGLLFTWEDVTDKISLERRLKTEIDVKAATFDRLYDGVAVFGSDGRLKLKNPVYERLWNLSEEQVSGEPHVSEILDHTKDLYDFGEDWDGFKARIVARLSERKTNFEQLERTDGIVLKWASVPLPDGATLMIYRDSTDGVRVERALRERNEALQEADQLKSEFVANVSYELRTPLNTIVGFSEILAGKYYGELNEKQTEYVRGILDSSQQLSLLISDILDLASIEAGHMVLDMGQFDLGQMLASILALSHERLRKKDLTIDLSCPKEIGEIVADKRRIKQVVFNLVNNAIRFTPSGGQISIDVARESSDILLTVSDTGVGIPSEEQDKVFDMFSRSINGERPWAGTGLGLSLVKAFVELHGGHVELQSRVDAGTRVTCFLPAKGQPPK